MKDEIETEKVSVKISKTTKNKAKVMAANKDTTMEDIITKAIDHYFDMELPNGF